MSEFTGMFCALSVSLTASVDYSWQKDSLEKALLRMAAAKAGPMSRRQQMLAFFIPTRRRTGHKTSSFATKLCCPEDMVRIHVILVEQFLCGCEDAR